MVWAKSDPPQTLYDHTQELLDRFEVLKKYYATSIKYPRVWDLLYYSVLYHDTGKVHTPFQHKINKRIGRVVYPKSTIPEIPHNLLSPFFVPLDDLAFSQTEKRVLIQAIAYHHERRFLFNEYILRQVFEQDLKDKLKTVQEHLKKEVAKRVSISRVVRLMEPRITSSENNEMYFMYILVKGLLHRLDHAASSDVPIELDAEVNLAELTDNYIRANYGVGSGKEHLRPLQKFALDHQDKNLIIIAQTGMGKTEAALLWAGNKKTFFTLPLRVSLNALFDRVYRNMGFTGVGLLHSSSASYLQENTDEEDWEVIYDQSRQLSNKLLFTTIDQILKFPAKFLGYEKFYATMAYSAVIIDEIQAYDPKIVAFLIKALEMIDAIGGRFMIMTATLPRVFIEKMESRGYLNKQFVVQKTFFNDDQLRHRLKLKDKAIEDDLDIFIENSRRKKVLVIVNTVRKARDLYTKIKDLSDFNIKLLHSGYVQTHRSMLENQLKIFSNDRKATGMWITTQLVEASIDIDFDELYTEVATLDSLFQRFGRCYRSRPIDHIAPNVFVYIHDPSDEGYIYDKDLVENGVRLLKEYDNQILRESTKIELVDKLYSYQNLKGTKYLEEFENAFKEIDSWLDYIYDHKEAQKLLRNIQNELVIPRSLFDSIVFDLVLQLSEEEDKKRRMELRREIEKYTLSVSKKIAEGNVYPIDIKRKSKNGTSYPILPYIKIIDLDYDFDEESISGLGIKPDEKVSNIL